MTGDELREIMETVLPEPVLREAILDPYERQTYDGWPPLPDRLFERPATSFASGVAR